MTKQEQNDGGAAFPRPFSRDKWDDVDYLPQEGMTLRDWFAGMALQGELASQNKHKQYGARCDEDDLIGLADWCYDMADAMLKVRNGDSL